MRTKLASETRRTCYRHKDRAAIFLRTEKRLKPVPATVMVRECDECGNRVVKPSASVESSTVRKI